MAVATDVMVTARPSMSETGWERAAVYLDLENLLFPWRDGSADTLVARFDSILDQVVPVAATTFITAVADHRLVRILVGSARAHLVRFIVVHPAPEAADIQLLRQLRSMPSSIDGVVVGSGDHVFAARVRELAATGLETVVLSGRRGLSAALRTEAAWSVQLAWPEGGASPLLIRTRAPRSAGPARRHAGVRRRRR